MVDALVSGTSVRKDVEVQVLLSAPNVIFLARKGHFLCLDNGFKGVVEHI